MKCPLCENKTDNESSLEDEEGHITWWCSCCEAIWSASVYGMLIDVLYP